MTQSKVDRDLDYILKASEDESFIEAIKANTEFKNANTLIYRIAKKGEDDIYRLCRRWKSDKTVSLQSLIKDKPNFTELKPIHIEFLHEYNNGRYKNDSLAAYREVKKHIHKVEAASILFNPKFWAESMNFWRQGLQEDDNMKGRKQTLLAKADEYVEKHKITVWKAFADYVVNDTHNTDPIPILVKLVDLFWFLQTLNRKRFMHACQDVVAVEYRRLQRLIEANPVMWKPKLRKLPKGLTSVLEVEIK